MRLAAVGDIHCKKTSQGAFHTLFEAMAAGKAIVSTAVDDVTRVLELAAGAKVPARALSIGAGFAASQGNWP